MSSQHGRVRARTHQFCSRDAAPNVDSIRTTDRLSRPNRSAQTAVGGASLSKSSWIGYLVFATWAGHVNDAMIRGWIDDAMSEFLAEHPHPTVRELNFTWDIDPENRLRRGLARDGLRLPRDSNGGRVRPVGVSNGKCTTIIQIVTELDGAVHAYPWAP